MARGCRVVCDAYSGDARWQRDGDALIVSPLSGPPVAVALGEVSGITGDGFNISLQSASGVVQLQKLGGDGPTLLQELRRDWPLLRAKLLRLSGGGKPPKAFSGAVKSPALAGSFRGFVVEDRLVFALDGQDVTCLFLADCQSVTLDEASYAVNVSLWSGQAWSFSKLGGETQAFASALQAARDQLAAVAQQTVTRYLPTVAAAGRAKLSWQWLPGRVLSVAALEQAAPGFAAAFAASWLHAGPREDCGKDLMKDVAPADTWLGYRPGSGESDPAWLWLLVRRSGAWSLEQLAYDDYATYLFKGGDELPGLVEGVVRLPEFSREALYLPLAELVGDKAVYAIAARDLPLLRDLKAGFAGRKIHEPKP